MDTELLRDRRRKLGLRDDKRLRGALDAFRATLLENLVRQEALESLADFAFIHGRSAFHSLDCALEAVDGLQLQQTVSLRLIFKMLV